MPQDASATCVCGHPQAAHEHYRSGSDCALCGRTGCARFRSSRGLGARLAGLLRRPPAGPPSSRTPG